MEDVGDVLGVPTQPSAKHEDVLERLGIGGFFTSFPPLSLIPHMDRGTRSGFSTWVRAPARFG